MDEDPEPLVERRLLRDPEDARELVLQRARPVGVDVGRRQHHPVSAQRQKRLERRLVTRGQRGGAGAGVALGVQQVLVQRRGLEDLPLLGGDRLQDPRVDVVQRLGDALPVRPSHQRRQLQQLQVAHDRVRDVQVGIEPQLGEPPAGARGPDHQLVAQQPVGGGERLGRAEQLLLLVDPGRLRAPAGRAPGTASARALSRDRRRADRRAPAAGEPGWPRRTARRRAAPRGGRRRPPAAARPAAPPGSARAPAPGSPRAARSRRRARPRAPPAAARVSTCTSVGGRRARAPPARAGRSRRRPRSRSRTPARSPAAAGSRTRPPAPRTGPAPAAG